MTQDQKDKLYHWLINSIASINDRTAVRIVDHVERYFLPEPSPSQPGRTAEERGVWVKSKDRLPKTNPDKKLRIRIGQKEYPPIAFNARYSTKWEVENVEWFDDSEPASGYTKEQMIAAMNYAVAYYENSGGPADDFFPDWNTWISRLPVAISSGYTAEQMGEAWDGGYANGYNVAAFGQSSLDRSTYISSLPIVKDAGVLVSALENILREKRAEGETNDTYAFNRCWNHADKALTRYNNPDAAAT